MSTKKLKQYRQSVLAEGDELANKLEKLSEFIDSEKFSELCGAEQEILLRQRDAMDDYLVALTERVELWGRV